jgi:glycosyltransferase involved in cell wall biosynthesis
MVFDDSSPANQEKYFPLVEQTRTHNAVFYVGPHEPEPTMSSVSRSTSSRRSGDVLGKPVADAVNDVYVRGTPVIAWRRGSVPEIVEHGVTGYIVDSIETAVEAVHEVDRLSRAACRQAFEERCDARRMAADYVDMYRRIIAAT